MKNKFYKLFTLVLAISGSAFTASAQLNCGSTEATQKLFQAHPELQTAFDDYNANITQILQNRDQRDDSTIYIIPVVFHIIHQNGSENISDAQVQSAVTILNNDFRFTNFNDTVGTGTGKILPPFKSLAADTRIEFRLAQRDPNGNCHNGIDRIYSHKTNGADDGSKLNAWPREKYLNIWVVKTIGSAGVAGYAYHPATVNGALYPVDGIIILHDYVGSIGTGSPGLSRALTHEVGHWINLQHPWGNNNDPNVACGDDLVNDTPPTKGHTACSATDLNTPYCTLHNINTAYKFDSVTTTSGTVNSTGLPSATGGIMGSFSATGVGTNSTAAGKFSFDNWDSGAADGATTYASLTGTVNTGKYYEFTVAPESNAYTMTLTGLTFVVDRNATGPRTWVVRSSVNSFGTNLTPTITPANTNLSVQGSTVMFLNTDVTTPQKGTKLNLSGALYTNRTSPVTFRIYAYNAEDSTGTFGVDSVYITGTNGLIENTQNYMDYSYCSKMYTYGQKDRMRAALESPIAGRNNLISAANHIATGVLNPQVCLPKVDFTANKVRVCAGDAVTFNKQITIGAADSVKWTFYGGSPATSTSMGSVSVTYPTSGLYKVVLVAYNSAGQDSTVKTDFIRVDPTWADIDYNGMYTEDFQNTTDFYWKWQVHNYDNNTQTWYVANNAGYQSTKCVVMAAHGGYRYDVDDLISPSYDLSYTTSNVMTFRLAAASHAGSGIDVNDLLKVYVSTNCGQSWSLRATFKDSTLINNGYNAGYFVPTSSSVWSLKTVSIPSSLATGNVRFKFEYTSGSESNNIYIDNINLSGVVGVSEIADAATTLSIYPNPANQSSTIAYHLNAKADTRIEVIDVIGKTVFSQVNNGQTEGDHSVLISKEDLNLRNGIYFVKFSVNNQSVTKKLVISE
jgi:PKD repeat protein